MSVKIIFRLWSHGGLWIFWVLMYENYINRKLLWEFLDTHLGFGSLQPKLFLKLSLFVSICLTETTLSLILQLLLVFKQLEHLWVLFFNETIHVFLDFLFVLLMGFSLLCSSLIFGYWSAFVVDNTYSRVIVDRGVIAFKVIIVDDTDSLRSLLG